MLELLKTVDTWFLILAVILLCGAVTILGGYFLWSVKGILSGFRDAVEELKTLIEKLFDKNNNHETRLSALEGRCAAMQCAQPGGRREYDPPERPESAKL